MARAGGPLLGAADVHGRGVVRDRLAQLPVRRDVHQWRLAPDRAWTGDVQPITYNAGAPVSVTLRLPMDTRNGIKRDLGLFVQDRWAMGRITLNLGLALRPVHRRDARERSAAEPLHVLRTWPTACPTASARTARPVAAATARCRTGRTSRRASASRWTCSATAAPPSRRASRATSPARTSRSREQVNPVEGLTRTDTRPWTDRDGNGLPLDANGNIQFNELGTSTSTRHLRPQRLDDVVRSRGAQRLGQARLQHGIHGRGAASARRSRLGERRLLPPRRSATRRSPTTCATTRTATTTFCINAPADPRSAQAAAAIRCAACRISSRQCSP